jgi:uncharacterized membrane protein YqaE (UPF0057 family)
MNPIVLIILAILLPPLGVFLKEGTATKNLVINIILCFLFWLPGVIHALWLVTKK